MVEETFTSDSTGMWALVWSSASQHEDGRTLVYLHGAGGFGTGMAGLFEYPDLPSLLREGMDLRCRVAIPSCQVDVEWKPSLVSSFLDDLDVAYGKPARGYDLVGYSRGGRGAYQFAATEPTRIRTLTAISARDMPQLVEDLCRVPVLICHGLDDQVTPVARIERMYDDLVAAGCNCKLVLVEGDHFIIADVLEQGVVFDWQRSTG